MEVVFVGRAFFSNLVYEFISNCSVTVNLGLYCFLLILTELRKAGELDETN